MTYKTSPRPTTTRLCPQELNRLRDRQELTGNNDNNISPFPSMPALPPPPGLGPFIPPPPFLQPPPSVLIHFNHHHHHDLIIRLVIFIFLHNFHLQILAIGTKDYLEIYLVHRHRLLLGKKAKEKVFQDSIQEELDDTIYELPDPPKLELGHGLLNSLGVKG